MNSIYNEPEFRVTKMAKEDVLTTSETVFGITNGFESPTTTSSVSEGGWNMPSISI